MFAAKPHSLLVPADGSFHASKAPTSPAKNKDDWKELLEGEVKKLGEAQERLYADARYAVLVIFQALDAAGKDGAIRHVFTGVNPSGLHVAAFKQPTRLELTRLPLENDAASARARRHHDLQSQLLRRGARRSRASGISPSAAPAEPAVARALGPPAAGDR
jgi:hypothetical protein